MSRVSANAQTGVWAGPLAKQECVAKWSQRTAVREANQSHAFDSPTPGECRGEQHACERQCMDALAGPQRSRESGASAGTNSPGQTEKTAAIVHHNIATGLPRLTDMISTVT